MMALTHMAIATAGVSFALGETSPAILTLAMLGSQIPDLDSTESWIGQIAFPVSRSLESRYPHRTLTHSFLATGAIALASLPLYAFGLKVWISLWLAHLLTCFADTFTKQGVQLFFPVPVWCVCGSNPNKRLTTGGTGEYWVLAVAIGLLILNLHLTSTGGILTKTSQTLGLKDGALRLYNESAATRHVYADIKGVWESDRTPADKRYFIIGVDGSEFIVTDSKGIYKTGQQLVTSHLAAEAGSPATTVMQTLTLSDEEAIVKLQALLAQHPNSLIYLSGSVVVDLPEEIKLTLQPNQFQTASLSGSTLNLTFHPIDQLLLNLKDQYATGTLSAKIISPRPQL